MRVGEERGAVGTGVAVPRVQVPASGQVQRDDGPGVKWECPDVLRDVALAACHGIPPVCLGAVPGEDILVRVERTTEGSPVVPLFSQGVDDVGLVVSAVVELEEVLLCQSVGHVIFGPYLLGLSFP
jgi:hypothetical protein